MNAAAPERLSLFISHTQSDKPIADAIRDLVKALFGESISVKYSSDKEGGGGVGSGAKWTDWIVEEILDATLTFVILTPASAQKPWVLWEAGAAAGVAAAARERAPVQIVPITYQVANNEMPDPFRITQVVKGDERSDVLNLLTELLEKFSKEKVRATLKLEKTVDSYLDAVGKALAELPLPVTEAAVQEWIDRIKEFSARHGAADIDQLCDWMNTAFGYSPRKGPEPLDQRLHRRLGELYAKGRLAKKAAEQFELARRLAPRDIYILRSLGKAYLDQDDLGKAEEMIKRIEKFDRNAFARDIEAAAFKMRWQKKKRDLNGAIATAEKALAELPLPVTEAAVHEWIDRIK
ncbi:MAG: TIR domain-containing protein, partial [Alphaproteobacteria bacterium]|nr:TIR domain-containing protein [Alphaproteobacteria bacterium]